MPFDPFRRFRARAHTVSVRASEEDSDESSPERGHPRIIHVSPKSDRKSGERLLVPERAKSAKESTRIALTLDKAPNPIHSERPSKKKSGVASARPTNPVDGPQPDAKPTLIRRVTSKLNISIPSRSGSTPALRSRPSTRTLPSDTGLSAQGPRSPMAVTTAPPLPNSFAFKQNREAALRERGLLPPRKDLSEQEREADERVGCAPSPVSLTFDGSTEAERFKASWLTANQSSEGTNLEHRPPVPPFLQSTRPSSPDAGLARQSGEAKADHLPAGRPSMCSSVPPLSTSSYLEVLPEEPWEQGPITPPLPLPPAKLPIIISSPIDAPPSPILVESPISCTFSSHCPGSTLESQSQSSHRPPVPEKENIRFPASRRRTSDSADRPRRATSALTRLGSHSLTNLRRSVTGSLKAPSSSTLASSSSGAQAPRAAIDPTMHSLGSIIRETRDIQDAESRRLSELAFLD